MVDGKAEIQENLLEGVNQRIRDIRQSPDGGLYFITDSGNGSVYPLIRERKILSKPF